MNISTVSSGIGLLFVFVLSYICAWVFKIRADKFYKPFHFAGGFLVFVFSNSLITNKFLCLVLVVMVGIAWEIYEWAFWKILSKRKIDRPRRKDTINDLIMDFIGGATAFILL